MLKRKLEELEKKYFDLVHLARCDPDEEDINGHQEAIRQKYPEEAAALADPEGGDWQHGFNSGMLAAVRLIQGYRVAKSAKARKEADDMFPFLDT